MESINRVEKGINVLINNKLDLLHNSEKNKLKKNIIINSNWNHSSNFKLNTFNNDYLLYKNKFIKNIPTKDKILNNSNKAKGIILPEIKTPSVKRERKRERENINLNLNSNICLHFTKIPKEAYFINNINNEQKKEYFSDKANLLRNIKLNRIIKNNNSETQTTESATNSIKNQNSSKNNIPNINEDLNKFGKGLISTGSITNKNIIIPIIANKRSTNLENEDDKNELENKKEMINSHILQNSRNNNIKSREIKGKINISMKNKELCNLFSNIQKLVPNFHKIKIEKGIDNNNTLLKSYSKKISFDYKSKNNINFKNNNLNVKSSNN